MSHGSNRWHLKPANVNQQYQAQLTDVKFPRVYFVLRWADHWYASCNSMHTKFPDAH